jgi:hypothetical protein
VTFQQGILVLFSEKIMADTKIRALERAAATGDVEAMAALLVERGRGGRTTYPLIELAAYLGDEVAQAACGWPSCENTPPCQRVEDARGVCQWCRRTDRRYSWGCNEKVKCKPCRPCIAAFGDHADFLIGASHCLAGREAAVRIVLAAVGPTEATVGLRTTCRECGYDAHQGRCNTCDRAFEMVCVAERWVLEGPSKQINRRAHKLTARYLNGYHHWWVSLGMTLLHVDSSGRRAVRTLGEALGGLPNYGMPWNRPRPPALPPALNPRTAVEAEVLPWALGDGDPLRDRIGVGFGS